MKLLLTSAGVKNPSIHDARVGPLGKPIAAWVGWSAASMVMTPRVGDDFVGATT